MLITRLRSCCPPASSQRGFTLVEMLIGMLCAVVVVGALAAVLETAFEQDQRITDAVAADQLGRIAITTVVEELHSACTGFHATALQVPSSLGTFSTESGVKKLNATNLWFVSAYGAEKNEEAWYSKVYEHDVEWEKKEEVSGKKLGNLVDYRWTDTGELNQETGLWPFPELKEEKTSPKYTKTILAEHVILPTSGEIFKYWKFNNSGSENKYTELKTESEIQTAAGEKETGIAKVQINFTQASRSGIVSEGHVVPMTDTVVLHFNAIESGEEGINDVCK